MNGQPLTGSTSHANSQLGGLNFLWLEMTEKCNLECVHCYTESSPHLPLTEKMKYEDWRHVLAEGFALGCKQVQFIGGEATLHPDLLQLIEDARAIGYTFVELFTNATLLNDHMLEVLQKHKVQVATSFYAPRAKTHDAITGRKGSFYKTVNGILQALDYGLSVRAAVIVMDANAHCVEETKAMLKGFGITQITVDRMRGVGRGDNHIQAENPLNELCGDCWRGKLCIDPGGRVYPCVFSRFRQVGDIDEGLQTILESESLKEFRGVMHDRKQQKTKANGNGAYHLGPGDPDDEQAPTPDTDDNTCGPRVPDTNDNTCGPRAPDTDDNTCGPRVPDTDDNTCGPRVPGTEDDTCGPRTPDEDTCGPRVPDEDTCGPRVPDEDTCGPRVPDTDDSTCGPRVPDNG